MRSRTVFAVIVLVLSFVAAPAMAAGPYVGGELGAVFLSTTTLTDNFGGSADLKSKTGFGLGLLGGFDFGTYRLEGELAYRKNNNKEITFPGDPIESAGGDVSTIALMVNGYYDFRMVSPTVVPYIGGGLGGARVKLNYIHQDGSTSIDDSDMVFAYQFAAGVGFAVNNQLTLDLGYKYFATAKPEFEAVDLTKVEGEYHSHNIFLGARFSF